MNRRRFVQMSGTALGALVAPSSVLAVGGCGDRDPRPSPATATGGVTDLPARELRLVAEEAEVDLGPLGTFRTWLYNGRVPGPEIRVKEGERLRVVVENRLPEDTTVHWHGVPVPNPMDGVPGVTQEPVPPGGTFVYEYMAEPAGTYMYHSHVGLQLDRGLYGALVVEESSPHVAYDREYTLLLDDLTREEPRVIPDSGTGMMGGMGMMGGGPSGPEYEAFLVNGRPPADPPTFEVARGERIRLRLVNPASQTTFRVALAGHRLRVTHTDGRPVEPVEVDSLLIGMGERYDVIVEADNPGVWNLIAAGLETNPGSARAVLRYRESRDARAPEGQVPDGLGGGARVLQPSDLQSMELDGAPAGPPDRRLDLMLTGGGMMGSPRDAWTIGRQAWPDADSLTIHEGERVQVRLENHSMMTHPMHLHGHFFRVEGALKETVIVPPQMGRVTFEFTADNPGDWFFHCHNLYHMESGMARVFRYA